MNTSIGLRRERGEAEAAKLVAALPGNIQPILKRLPFGAQWALAAAVNELRTKGNRDVYLRGIAIGQTSAALERDEITQSQFEALALYIGNLPD
jgi:Na+/H+ antiporter NhaB